MIKLLIDNEKIALKLISKPYGSNHHDWELKMDEIKGFGTCRTTENDEDTFLFVIIDKKNNTFIIDCTYKVDGYDEFIKFIEDKYNVVCSWESDFYGTVLYPPVLAGQKIFEGYFSSFQSFSELIRAIFMFDVHSKPMISAGIRALV